MVGAGGHEALGGVVCLPRVHNLPLLWLLSQTGQGFNESGDRGGRAGALKDNPDKN